MPPLRIATFNLYFFGDRNSTAPTPKVIRDDGDLTMLATILAGLDADVIAFQEIHDRVLLQRVLDEANAARPGRDWRVGGATAKSARAGFQVVIAVDAARVSVHGVSTPIAKVPRSRLPLVVDLGVEGVALQVVAVHLKSDWPDPAEETAANDPRREECARLAAWMDEHPVERRVLLGDFNTVAGNAVLQPLLNVPTLRHLPHRWPDGAVRWTTATDARFLDPCAIDHIWVSGIAGEVAEVACFDLRADLQRDGMPWPEWLQVDLGDPQGPPGHLQRVSDHRPIWAVVQL